MQIDKANQEMNAKKPVQTKEKKVPYQGTVNCSWQNWVRLQHRRRLALITFAVLTAGPLAAQETVDLSAIKPKDTHPVIESIVVTGSLLPKGDFTSNAPITTISSEMFEMSNATNVETMINSMPQVIGGTDRTSNFGFGLASAELRGLGSQRTLVLLNSRRFVPSVADGGTVDLNFIPVGLIDRVEVLTGGASAAYGSDAMAGVINFILKDDVEGWEVNIGSETAFDQLDAGITNFNITNGGSFASHRGKYMIHLDITDRSVVSYSDRELTDTRLVDHYNDEGQILGFRDEGIEDVRGGSQFPGTSSSGFFDVRIMGLSPTAPLGSFDASGNIVGLDAASLPNLNANNSLQQAQKRTAFLANFSFDATDTLTVYGDFTWSNSEVPGTMGPPAIGVPFNQMPFSIDGNPFIDPSVRMTLGRTLGTKYEPVTNDQRQMLQGVLGSNNFFQLAGALNEVAASIGPTALAELDRCFTGSPGDFQYFAQNTIFGLGFPTLIQDDNQNCIGDIGSGGYAEYNIPGWLGRWMSEMSNTSWTNDYEVMQVEFGIEGSFSDSWGYDFYVQRGEVSSNVVVTPLINNAALQRGLLVRETEQGSGIAECIPSSGDNLPCIPVNIFGSGSVSTEAVAYISEDGMQNTTNTQSVIFGTISGNTMGLFEMPLDAGPVGAAFGFEYLKNETEGDRNSIMEPGAYSGWHNVPGVVNAETDSTSLFAELLIPLASGLPGIDFLELELGIRTSDHSHTGSSTSYKTALSYYPTPDLQVRASFNEAFRSPSMIELFVPNVLRDGVGLGDWCAGYPRWTPPPFLRAACLETGVPAENFGSIDLAVFDVDRDFGGNQDLLEETAATFSAGFVWTPYEIDGLSVSLDYFDIEIENFIEINPLRIPIPGAGDVIAECYDGSNDLGRRSFACSNLTRDSTGKLIKVFTGYDNVGTHKLSGFDINLNYQFDFLDGIFNLVYVGTKLRERSIDSESLGSGESICLGTFNNNCGLNTPVPKFKHRMSLDWSHDSWTHQVVWKYISSIEDGDDDTDYVTESIGSYSTVDVSSIYDTFTGIQFVLGVKNALDESAPIIGSNIQLNNEIGSPNTYPLLYDVFGRTIFAKIKLEF